MYGRGRRPLQHATGSRDQRGGRRVGTLRRDYDTDVPGHRLQHDVHAQPIEPRDPRRGWNGSAPVLAVGRDQLFGRSQVLPVFRVHAHMHRRVPAAFASVPELVRARPRRVLAVDATLRVLVARENAMRQVAGERRARTLHGSRLARATTRAHQAHEETDRRLAR